LLVGTHEPPPQATQPPALHTMFVPPQPAPFGWLPVSEQTGDPVTQVITPVLHMFAGWQLSPCGHATHVPALQTLPGAQPVPLASEFPVSVQLMLGVQTVRPP
jgi:hypothetical protein